MAKASRKYGIPVPEVHFYRSNWKAPGKRGPSQYDPNTHSIRLRPRHVSLPIVLHETAHAIVCYLLGVSDEIQGHGPEWLGVYMVLLEDYKVSTLEALRASADKKKLIYRTRGFVGPDKIRKRYKKRRKEAREYWR